MQVTQKMWFFYDLKINDKKSMLKKLKVEIQIRFYLSIFC